MLFSKCLRNGVFPNNWKKSKCCSSAYKRKEQLASNYSPASLLLICSNFFEKLIFDCIYNFLDQNCLLNVNQSGFRPGYTGIHQLVAITHIFTTSDVHPSLEVCGILLDLSKNFDRVWYKGLIHKVKDNGKDGNLSGLTESFLHNKYQSCS